MASWTETWKSNVKDKKELQLIENIEKCDIDLQSSQYKLYDAQKVYSDYKAQKFAEAMKDYPQKAIKSAENFYNILAGNSDLNELLLSEIGVLRISNFEIDSTLRRLGIFTVMDLVARPHEFYAQVDVLGEKNTLWIEDSLQYKGLKLGMLFSAVLRK